MQRVNTMEKNSMKIALLVAIAQSLFIAKAADAPQMYTFRVSAEAPLLIDGFLTPEVINNLVVWDETNDEFIGVLGRKLGERYTINDNYSTPIPFIQISLCDQDQRELCKLTKKVSKSDGTEEASDIIHLPNIKAIRISLLKNRAGSLLPRGELFLRYLAGNPDAKNVYEHRHFSMVPAWTHDSEIVKTLNAERVTVHQDRSYVLSSEIADSLDFPGYYFAMEYIKKIQSVYGVTLQDLKVKENMGALISFFQREHILKRDETEADKLRSQFQ